jgi:hypothetical protein
MLLLAVAPLGDALAKDPKQDKGGEAKGTATLGALVSPIRRTPYRPETRDRIDRDRILLTELHEAIQREERVIQEVAKAAEPSKDPTQRSAEHEAYPGQLQSLATSYRSLGQTVFYLRTLLDCRDKDPDCYPEIPEDVFRDQAGQALIEAAALLSEADRLSSLPRRRVRQIRGPGSVMQEELEKLLVVLQGAKSALLNPDVIERVAQAAQDSGLPRSAGAVEALTPQWTEKAFSQAWGAVLDAKNHKETILLQVLSANRWDQLASEAERIDDGARTIERKLRALQPPEVDCWALQDDSAYRDRYVIVFDEATGTLHEPPRYTDITLPSERVRDLYAGQEVVVCIAGTDLANRYVLTHGNASVGERAFHDALTFASSASLRTGAGSVEIPADGACEEKVDDKGVAATAAPDAAACKGMLAQARELDRMIELVATARDSLGARLVGDSSHVMRRAIIEPLSAAATPVCLGPEGAEDVFPVYRMSTSSDWLGGTSEQAQDAVFDIDGSRGCAERLPLSALLNGSSFTWNDGTWSFDTFDGLAPDADGKVSLARGVRGKVQASLEKAVEEYDKVVALALNYRKHALRRNVLFNLGTFNENTLLSATLQRNAITFHLGDEGRTLLQQTTSTSFAITRTVRDSTHWGVQPGYLLSGLPQREYELVTGSATGAPNELRLRQEDLFHAPALFVNFYTCPQNLSMPVYRRECTGGAHRDWLRYLPSFAVGVPVSPDIVDGNVFVGIGLPYIPYVTITTGVHLGLVDMAPASALSIGTSATALEDATFQQLGVAPFISINASAEILGLLFPQLKPAN